jgi:hypothetical protein
MGSYSCQPMARQVCINVQADWQSLVGSCLATLAPPNQWESFLSSLPIFHFRRRMVEDCYPSWVRIRQIGRPLDLGCTWVQLQVTRNLVGISSPPGLCAKAGWQVGWNCS